MTWLKDNVYAAIALAVLGFGLIGLHWWVATTAVKRADAAGYARANAENQKALTDKAARDATALAKDRQNTKELIHDYQVIVAVHEANLADTRTEFAGIRVRLEAAASGGLEPIDIRRTSARVDAAGDHEGGELPSLAVIGQELSNCELEGDRFTALQKWVRNRRHVEIDAAQ